MLSLLPELKILIAEKDSEIWFRMWRYDPEFRRWAESSVGRKLFVDLFTLFKVDENGVQKWKLFGKRHRENDLPALVCDDGTRYWYRNGKLHRENDLPAMILHTGSRCWYRNGSFHRDNDLPAIIWADGTQEWWQNGEHHHTIPFQRMPFC